MSDPRETPVLDNKIEALWNIHCVLQIITPFVPNCRFTISRLNIILT